MEKSLPLESVQKISMFKRVLLYLNVSAFRIVKEIPTLSDYRKNYHASGLSVLITVFGEVTIFKFFFHREFASQFLLVFGVPFFYHSLLELLFMKQIIIIGYNYNAFYNKALFYIFLVFFMICIVGMVLFFNDRIGK
ncbi:hypothetical protein BH09BAC6_BH09BAC6_17990 [soil metagenome]|jgi:hypothetical protein